MAGLFDWLTDGMGALGGNSASASQPPPMSDPTGGTGLPPPPPPPMPPMQMTGSDAPPITPPPPAAPTPPPNMTAMGDQTGAGGPIGTPSYTGDPAATDLAGGMQGGSPGAPPPLDPSAGFGGARSPAPRPNMPPNAAPTAGMGLPPAPDSGPAASPISGLPPSILARALGLDANSGRQIATSLGKGLTAGAAASHLPGLAAFSAGAGGALTGGEEGNQKIVQEQQKYLDQAITAAKTGDERALNKARTQLALAQAKQAQEGKDSVLNSPEQLYARAQSLTAQTLTIKSLKKAADDASAVNGPSSTQAVAARKELKDAEDNAIATHMAQFGVSQKKIADLSKQPGMSQDNPITINSQDDIHKAMPGQWVKLPKGSTLKDGTVLTEDRVVRKKLPAAQVPQQPGAPAPGAAAPAPAAPAAPVVTAPAGSRSEAIEQGEDEVE